MIESTVHFPTDISLLWDSMRKCLDLIGLLHATYPIGHWRNYNYWRKKVKKAFGLCARIHQRKGKGYQERLQAATQVYVDLCKELKERMDRSLPLFAGAILAEKQLSVKQRLHKHVMALTEYKDFVERHIDLVARRILKGETIPHQDKVFSIFEDHVEWIQKGKHHKKVELGHNTLVCSDQFHFIVDYEVIIKQADVQLVQPLAQRLQTTFGHGYHLGSISFDKGFWSQPNKDCLAPLFDKVILPKKGKKTVNQKVEESATNYQQLRQGHSAVESNINELEQSGLNKVPDKGIEAFKRYVGLGVLAYNLKRLGRILIAQQTKKKKKTLAKAA